MTSSTWPTGCGPSGNPERTVRDVVRTLGPMADHELICRHNASTTRVAGISSMEVTTEHIAMLPLQELEERFRLAFEDNMADDLHGLDDRHRRYTRFANIALTREILGTDPSLYLSEDWASPKTPRASEARPQSATSSAICERRRLIYSRSCAHRRDKTHILHVISNATSRRSALAAQLSHQLFTTPDRPHRSLDDARQRAQNLRDAGTARVAGP